MFNISSFLEKFSKNITTSEDQIQSIVQIIKTYTQLDIPSNNIEIKDSIVRVTVSPALKNKIFIHKKAILDDVASLLGIKIADIR
jgi:hypothetical protein